MILEPIKPSLPILNSGHQPLLAPSHHLEPIRQRSNLVTMAHPNLLLVTNLLRPKNPTSLLDLNLHLPVLLLLPNFDQPTQPLHNQLEAVADAQYEDAVRLGPLDEPGWETGRVRGVDGVGPAGEDDDARAEVGDGLEGAGPGDAEGEDGERSDSASDEVGVLGPKIEDQNKV